MKKTRTKSVGQEKNKEKAIELAVDQIERQFGKGSIMRLGAEGAMIPIESIPTGSLSLDIALGIGGVPRGRVIEIFGPEGSGKTTLTCSIIANAQKLGGVAAFIDAEHALDVSYARKIGVDVDNLLISQPDTGEQALEIAEVLIRSGAIDVVVVDSVAALVPAAEIEGEMGESHVGLQARLMSQALRKLAGAVSKSKTCMIFTNQIRMKIGVLYGNPETTSGGTALKFYSTVRLDIRRIGQIKVGDQVIGSLTRVKVVKNKVAPPFRQAEFEIIYGEGISYEGDLLELGVASGILSKTGSWYSFGDERLGQGKDNARLFLKQNPDITKKIEEMIREHYGLITGLPRSPVPLRDRRIRRMRSKGMSRDSVEEVRRRWGKLFIIRTSQGKRYLVFKEPKVERFLHVGYEIDEEEARFLEENLAFSAALSLAYKYLSIRDRGEGELRGLLRKDGVDNEEVLEGVIRRLKSNGFLDDRKLAANYIDFLMRHRPSGPHAVRTRLRRLGIDDALIDEVVSERIGPDVEREAALELAKKKMKPGMDRRRMVRRIHDFLLRRGFSSYIVNDICSMVLRGEMTEEKDEG